MKVQKFRGQTSVEALAKVKEALGEDAVILSTRRVREGGKWLYEMTAAVDFEPPEPETPFHGKEGFSLVLREIEGLKGLIEGLKCCLKPRSPLGELLLSQGVPAEVLKIFGQNGDLNKEAFLKKLSSSVAKRVETKPFSRVQVFIGQAGVGKTTSLVKLAARFSCNGQRVGLLSLDTVRVGAREQISRYAELLDLPLAFARPEEFKEALKGLKNWDYVLVDTPAISASFPEHALARLLKASPEVSLHLVLRATEAASAVKKLWERLEGLGVRSLVITHLEALGSSGPLFWIFMAGLPPVSFFSTGDRVPEDFERATPKRLLSLLLRNLEMEETYVA